MTLVSFPMTNYYSEFFLEDQCLDEWNAPHLHNFIDNSQTHQDYFHFGVKRGQDVNYFLPPNRHVSNNGFHRTENSINARIISSEDPESKHELKRRALRSSCEKLSHIEDPESCLLRTVLINNTLKTIHNDIKKEKERIDTRILSVETEIPTKKLRRFCDPDYDRCNADKLYYGFHHFSDRNQLQTFDNQSSEQTDQQSNPQQQQRVNNEHRQSSIFTELESVFHSFMCTLET